MTDPIKQFISVIDAKAEAKLYRDAGRMMAEHCDARIAKCRTALEAALHALNTIPNRRLRHGVFKDTYAVAAEIERVLKEKSIL